MNLAKNYRPLPPSPFEISQVSVDQVVLKFIFVLDISSRSRYFLFFLPAALPKHSDTALSEVEMGGSKFLAALGLEKVKKKVSQNYQLASQGSHMCLYPKLVYFCFIV